MRWPFGPPHLTLKPSKKNKNKEKKAKREKKKNSKNTQKEFFQLSVKIFSFLGGCPKFPFFDTLAQKARTQKTPL